MAAVDDRDFSEVARSTFDLFEGSLVQLLPPDQAARCFAPATLAVNGDHATGAIVVLEDAILLVWAAGWKRVANAILPAAAIRDLRRTRRTYGDATPHVDALVITAESTWDLAMFPSATSKPFEVVYAAVKEAVDAAQAKRPAAEPPDRESP